MRDDRGAEQISHAEPDKVKRTVEEQKFTVSAEAVSRADEDSVVVTGQCENGEHMNEYNKTDDLIIPAEKANEYRKKLKEISEAAVNAYHGAVKVQETVEMERKKLKEAMDSVIMMVKIGEENKKALEELAENKIGKSVKMTKLCISSMELASIFLSKICTTMKDLSTDDEQTEKKNNTRNLERSRPHKRRKLVSTTSSDKRKLGDNQ